VNSSACHRRGRSTSAAALTRNAVVLVLVVLGLVLLTASAANAHGRGVAVAITPEKTPRGIKYYGYYSVLNRHGAVRHRRVAVWACLQVRLNGRWTFMQHACKIDRDRRDWTVDVGGRVSGCIIGRHRYRSLVFRGWARTRSGQRRHVRRDASPARRIRCRA
jgi:hypothetical protein